MKTVVMLATWIGLLSVGAGMLLFLATLAPYFDAQQQDPISLDVLERLRRLFHLSQQLMVWGAVSLASAYVLHLIGEGLTFMRRSVP